MILSVSIGDVDITYDDDCEDRVDLTTETVTEGDA